MDFVGAIANSSSSSNENDPILYMDTNRTAAVEDIRSVLINVFFVTLFIGFLIIFPGIRQEKLPTFLCIITSLGVGAIILNAAIGTTWHVGHAHVSAPYKAFSRDKIHGELRVNIGLMSVNITLKAFKLHSKLHSSKPYHIDINYNERFSWIGPKQMSQEFHDARMRGLPYPILTVIDYLSQDEAGFSWSRKYRQAGYYCYITMWLSFYLWILMIALHCAAPRYGVYAMQVLGCSLLASNVIYAQLIPTGWHRLVIPLGNVEMAFHYGSSFWYIAAAGCVSLTVGTLITITDWLFPNYIFTTILYVDFDAHNSNRNKQRHQLSLQQKQMQRQKDALPSPNEEQETTITTSSPEQPIMKPLMPRRHLSPITMKQATFNNNHNFNYNYNNKQL